MEPTDLEDIIDPDLPIVDPHHHLPSGWMQYELDDALGDYGSGHNVSATVHVEAHSHYRADGRELLKPVGETEHLVSVAEEAESRGIPLRICAGIVGHVDLTRGRMVSEALDAHIAAGKGRFRGIRANYYWNMFVEGPWQPSAISSLVENEEICDGLAEVASRDLSCDLVAFHPNLPDVARLADRFPSISFIVNHLGAPMDSTGSAAPEELIAQWEEAIATIARRPNIFLKLGGLTNTNLSRSVPSIRALRDSPPSSIELAEAYRPYVACAVGNFGASRCMFESNFPVDREFVSFRNQWNAFKRLASAFAPAERLDLLGGTAARAYRI